MLIHDNGDFISFFHMIVKFRLLDEQKAIVDGIAEKDPCEGFCDDTLNPQCFDDLRSLLPGGTAAKVLSGNDNIAFPDLSGQFRSKGTEAVLFHIVNGLERQILRRDNDIRIDIISQDPDPSCK